MQNAIRENEDKERFAKQKEKLAKNSNKKRISNCSTDLETEKRKGGKGIGG